MASRVLVRLNAALGRFLPEQRLFLKSSDGTRFVRLRPLTQTSVLGIGAVVVAWTVTMTSVVLIDAISGGGRDQALQEQLTFQARLNAISEERDHRAGEAAAAIERFSLAMDEVSAMQSRLLASEERRREMETAVDVMQATLRRTMDGRDRALERAAQLRAELSQVMGDGRTIAGHTHDMERTVAFLSEALEATAADRDTARADAEAAMTEVETLAYEARLAAERNDRIFRQIEEAVAVGMAPLDELFNTAGMPTDRIIEEVRRGYSGQGGPLGPEVLLSTRSGEPDPTYRRAAEVLEQLDLMNLYRLTAERLPLNDPVAGPYRFTSPFGYRTDPINGGTRMHSGLDFRRAIGNADHVRGRRDGRVCRAAIGLWADDRGRAFLRPDHPLRAPVAHSGQRRGKGLARGPDR